MEHPLVLAAANGDDLTARIAALKAVLGQAVERLRQSGRDGPRAADAATALLRLESRYEELTVAVIHERLAPQWPRQGTREPGPPVRPSSFRKHVETPRVLEPLADELRRMEAAALSDGADTLDHDQLEARIAELLPAATGLSPVALRVWARERFAHAERLTAIAEEGSFRIRDEAEMFDLLELLTGAARREMHAVDHIDLADWDADPRLVAYLEGQFERVRRDRIPLTRIRLVDEAELADPSARSLLASFVARHDSADVTLLLCHATAVTYLKTAFTPRTGLFMIDSRANAAAIIGWGGGGPRDQTELHLHETGRLRAARREFELLRRHAVEHCDRDLRSRIGLESRHSPSGAARTRT